MKKRLYLWVTMCLLASTAFAGNGDTTFVQAHSDKWLDWYNNFDTTVAFPDGSKTYRNVYMTFTLGKYLCPGSPQYCGDWDYTVQTFLMTKSGDTVELGRLITPYANASYPRTPWTWKQRYVFDVTDYYPLLKDSATVRIHYSGYSGGFTANVRFAFVEGTPARNVVGVKPLWDRSYDYGKASDPIDNNVTAQSLTAPSGTSAAELKFTITGHGADGLGCSEFCIKNYQVLQNGSQIDAKAIWRDNCGKNHLYPQSGTWVYDRGNWCPGDQVQVNSHKLQSISGGSNFNVDVNFDAHTSSGGSQASYTVASSVIFYGAFNKSLDAQMEDVISPNNHEMHFRENTMCGKPKIKVKNTGSTPITSLKIEYGVTVAGTSNAQYDWTGTIAPLETAEIELPELWYLRNLTGTNTFVAKVIKVNGQADEDGSNNEFKAGFAAGDRWPMAFRVVFKTNSAPETRWKIVDVLGNTVAQRNGTAPNTTYSDTVTLGPSCYKMEVEDDGCDGLYWWANPGAGSGSLQVFPIGSSLTPLALRGYFNRDFGCGFTQYFTTDFPTGISTTGNEPVAIQAMPNPARDRVTISLTGLQQAKGTLTILDAMGRVVKRMECRDLQQEIAVGELVNGVYTVLYTDALQSQNRLQTRLLIAR